MFYYKIFDLKVKSDYDLGDAYCIEACEDYDVLIREEELDKKYTEETEGELANKYGCIEHYEKDWSCVRFVRQGTFIMQNGNEIIYKLKEECEIPYVRQIFLCYCLTTIIVQKEEVAIHGSGLYRNGKALIVSGDSGAGKSTLTAELLDRDYVFMADDTVAIKTSNGKIEASAGFPLRKLCKDAVDKYNIAKEDMFYLSDAGKEKYAVRVKNDAYHHESVELGAMVIISIGDTDEVQVVEVTGADKIKYITNNLYKRSIYERIGFSTKSFLECVKMANAVPVYRILRPKDKMTVDEQVEKLEKVLW